MANNIDTYYTALYNETLNVAAQQMESRLYGTVEIETIQGAERAYFERIGALGEMREKTARFSEIEYDIPEHSRRLVVPRDYYQSSYVDSEDALRMRVGVGSEYARAQMMAASSKIDSVIIDAALGTAFSGKTGTTPVTFSANQQIPVNYVEAGTGTACNLTWQKLRRTMFLFESQEEDMNGGLTCVYSANQKQNLLKIAEEKNIDGYTQRQIEAGANVSFMGFNFIRSQLLPKNGNNRSVLVYPRSAIKFASLKALSGRVAEIPQRHFASIIYTNMSCAAVRMWETRVVEILCDETKFGN